MQWGQFECSPCMCTNARRRVCSQQPHGGYLQRVAFFCMLMKSDSPGCDSPMAALTRSRRAMRFECEREQPVLRARLGVSRMSFQSDHKRDNCVTTA